MFLSAAAHRKPTPDVDASHNLPHHIVIVLASLYTDTCSFRYMKCLLFSVSQSASPRDRLTVKGWGMTEKPSATFFFAPPCPAWVTESPLSPLSSHPGLPPMYFGGVEMKTFIRPTEMIQKSESGRRPTVGQANCRSDRTAEEWLTSLFSAVAVVSISFVTVLFFCVWLCVCWSEGEGRVESPSRVGLTKY